MLPRASIKVSEIIEWLKKNNLYTTILKKILYQKIVETTALKRGLKVTPEEIQDEADSWRFAKRLYKASDTLEWLAERMIGVEDWQAGIRDRLLARKLAESLFDREAENFFDRHRQDYDRVILYQIVVPYEKLACQLFYQIEEQELSFYEAAHFYDIDERRRLTCGYEGHFYRWNLNSDIAAAVFGARAGQLTGPIQTEQGYHLLLVEEVIPAELTPERREEIVSEMFDRWLAIALNYMQGKRI